MPMTTRSMTAAARRCWTCDTRPATHRTYRDALEDYELTCDECHKDEYPEEYEEKEYYKVCCAENPDVEYFDTLHEAKAFCDKHADLDYGLIMLCDFEKNEIGDWGDYDDGNFVEPTEFEEFTYYGTKFWKNTDGKGRWFYEHVDPGGDIPYVQVGEELGMYTSDTELEFTEEGKNAGDYVPALYWAGVIGEKMFLNDNLHPVAELIKRLQICPTADEDDELCKNCDSTYTGKKEPFCIMGHKNCDKGLPHITTLHDEDYWKNPMTADSRAHEIISHRAKLFENNIVFGNFFSREQFEEECAEIPEDGFGIKTHISEYFDEFQEHIHLLGRQGHFNELMKEYFEVWLEANE